MSFDGMGDGIVSPEATFEDDLGLVGWVVMRWLVLGPSSSALQRFVWL